MPSQRSRSASRSVVFVTFECEFNRFGGLGAVMGRLPKAMLAAEDCVVVAPYFPELTDLATVTSRGADVQRTRFSFPMGVGGSAFDVDVHEVSERVDTERGRVKLRTYLVASAGFFTAPRGSGPYVNPTNPALPLDPDSNPIDGGRLTEDALLFSSAVPGVVRELVREGVLAPDVVLHLQDWETAAVALAVTPARAGTDAGKARCVLTLHNPYDRAIDPARDTALVATLAEHLGLGEGSLLAQAMDALEGPISTVSGRFAEELTGDPLMTGAFAPHLQERLTAHDVVGVNNGQFIPLGLPAGAIDLARAGDLTSILEFKAGRRAKLAAVLEEYRPAEAWGELAGLADFAGPIFLMFGRDDPRQKGYDVAAKAIGELEPGRAKFVFTPIPGDEGLAGLGFLRRLAAERSGDVKVFPFRMARGYGELQEGSTFLLMPSLYEPFGGAIEGYASGTPVVARATGGLALQVVPHSGADVGTGFLYREEVPAAAQRAGWERIIACSYWDSRPRRDRVQDRTGDPLYEAMVAATASSIDQAIDFYEADRASGLSGYARMILNGADAMDQFSWAKAVAGYRELY